MPKRVIGIIVACVLAVSGGATLAVPVAVAAPPSSSAKASTASPAAKAKAAKVKAAQSKAAKAKATKAAKARARAAARAAKAARARATYIAQVGQRGATLTTAAAAARSRAKAASKVAVQARSRAAVTTKASAAAKAKVAAIAKTKPSTKAGVKAKAAALKQAKATAKAASRLAAKANKRAAAKVATAAKATDSATKQTAAATKARGDYAAKAAARASAAATAARRAKARAATAAQVSAKARLRAKTTTRSATAAKAKITAITKSKPTTKAKIKARAAALKKAKATAKAAVALSAKAKTRAASLTKATAQAKAAAKTKKALAAKLKRWVGPKAGWKPKDSLIFNNPRGTKKQKLAIISQINRGIDSTPAGGEIRMAQYLFDIGSVANKLIAADRRGASVQILVDDGETNKYIRRVRKALGTDKTSRSFVATCHHGCMSSRTSVIHAKFYLFSVAGKSRNVSMISSANPYTGNTFNSWNNNHTIVGDTKIYNSLSTYFTDMLRDKDDLNYYRVTTSGKYTIYLYPRAVRKPEDVVLLNVLARTSCKPTGKEYGSNGRTLIRVANWGWSTTRLDIAKQLWKLYDSGCKVQVMINKGRITRGVLKVLLKPSKKYGKMPVYDAWYDANNNNVAGLYVHDKTVTINGLVSGKNVKITWTGSQNFTALGTLANNDIILRVIDPKVAAAYTRHFAYIRRHYTHRMYSVPAVTRRPKD